jgi:hypothetical protein
LIIATAFLILSNKLAIAMSDGCANAKGKRLSWLWGFFRILYQKALTIAELSLEVNHANAPLRSKRADAIIKL